jgi:nucleoid DNA-binding protein
MKSLSQVVTKALYSNDCVIVPDFGGFITQKKSAFFDVKNQIVLPPSKNLTFNVQLQQNDGLIVNLFALENQLAYEQSAGEIENCVKQWKSTLQNGEKLKLSQIGDFWCDAEGNIQFLQDRNINLLLSAYGLDSLHFSPSIPEVETSITVKNKTHFWKYAVAATLLLPLAFYSFWIPTKTDVFQAGMISYKDFNPLHEILPGNYRESSILLKPLGKVADETYFQDLVKEIPPAQVEQDKVDFSLLTFHCIAGCFADPSNANRLMQKLNLLGFSASVFNDGGLYKVSAGSGFSEGAMQEVVRHARSKNIEVWILKK